MENGDSKLESGALQMKVTELQDGWQEVLDKAARLDAELVAALSASHDVMDQMKELRIWLNESREFLYSRRQIGGRPESARNQITKHKVCLLNPMYYCIRWSESCPLVVAVVVVVFILVRVISYNCFALLQLPRTRCTFCLVSFVQRVCH